LGTGPTPPSEGKKKLQVSIEFQLISDVLNTVSAESSIRVDLIELFVPKFNFVAIIVNACDIQSLVISPKST
jgi:hypothetical protein